MDAELKTVLGQILTAIETSKSELTARIDGVREDLTARIDGVREDLTARIDGVREELGTRIDGLSIRLDAVEDGTTEIRRVTSANHYKLMGNIDRVADMLADHMSDTTVHHARKVRS